MPNTTPTAASAHLVTHEHGRAVDTHLHEPAPARRPARDPMPQPTDFGIEGPHIRKPTTWARIAMAVIAVAVFSAVVLTLAPGGFLFNR